MNVVYFLRDDGACGHYRVAQPLNKMAALSNGKHKVMEFRQGSVELFKLEEYLKESHIVVIPRLAEERFITLCKELKKAGQKIVIDHDDNMFEVSPLSPHYDCCGTEEVRVRLQDGTLMELWTDGKKNFSIEKNKKLREGFKEALSVADMVTVTQPHLREVYLEYNPNVVCLPNCVDLYQWSKDVKIQKKEPNEIRMGWYGGHSHYEDWTLLSKVLQVVMDKHPNLRLVLMGTKFDGPLGGIKDKSRIEFHAWVPTTAYPYKAITLGLDFAIIPLVASKFNSCKSNIKWVEQGALSIPSVTSFVSPYKEEATEFNGIFVENNTIEGWVAGISMMVEDPILRAKMGGEAYATVAAKFDANKEWIQWEKAYSTLL